jgi:ABC-2 type transport system ATP-binding protein
MGMAMIEVEHLTKRYGSALAVDRLDFSVEKGEIVGFLGRNGAGKSTTMRILAGSLGASEGVARIGGLDVAEHPRQVKRLVGYLPEVPPLYGDLTVRQYLEYAARLKQVSAPREAAERAMEQVGLIESAGRLIDHLSKGFRQRVGIAQALVHQPSVLILDEPVSGLDPVQRHEIIELVKTLSEGETTVVLSTHVLAEIESVCDRVIIIHGGRIVAQDTVEHLADRARAVVLRVARCDDGLLGRLRQLNGITSVEVHETGEILIRGDRDVREDLARVAVEAGLLELRPQQRLQDAFLRLIGEVA